MLKKECTVRPLHRSSSCCLILIYIQFVRQGSYSQVSTDKNLCDLHADKVGVTRRLRSSHQLLLKVKEGGKGVNRAVMTVSPHSLYEHLVTLCVLALRNVS